MFVVIIYSSTRSRVTLIQLFRYLETAQMETYFLTVCVWKCRSPLLYLGLFCWSQHLDTKTGQISSFIAVVDVNSLSCIVFLFPSSASIIGSIAQNSNWIFMNEWESQSILIVLYCKWNRIRSRILRGKKIDMELSYINELSNFSEEKLFNFSIIFIRFSANIMLPHICCKFKKCHPFSYCYNTKYLCASSLKHSHSHASTNWCQENAEASIHFAISHSLVFLFAWVIFLCHWQMIHFLSQVSAVCR